MAARLTPARFVALYELATTPGPIGHLDKRTARALMDQGLIEWSETTDHAHIYRATPAGVDAARDHLAYLAKREIQGRVYRSDAEQGYQDRAPYRLEQLEKAVAQERPETPVDRIADATDTETGEVRFGTSSDAPELVAVADLLSGNGYKPVTLKAAPTVTVHGTGYFVAPAWDDKLRVAMLTDEVIMRGHDLLPARWETILIGAGYRVAERHPNALIVVPPTPKTAIPCGHYSEGQARLVAAALTGDTDTVRGRLDEIAAADDQGTTHGTLAEHADDPTTREILSVLDNDGDLEAAEITGDDLTADTVDGVVAVPRHDQGAVYVYWYTQGSPRNSSDRAPAELGQIRRTLEGAGYRVALRERGSLVVRVLLPTHEAGTGVEPRNATNPAVNAAAAVLGEAGLFLASLSGDHDNASAATGYVVTDHNPTTVWVLHLSDGSTRDPHTGQYPRHKLAKAAEALSNAGWSIQDPDEWTWRLWARRPEPVHYRRTLADHGAVCGAAALSDEDPGMSATPGAVTCPTCCEHLDSRPPLPRRTRQENAIDRANTWWTTPAAPRMADGSPRPLGRRCHVGDGKEYTGCGLPPHRVRTVTRPETVTCSDCITAMKDNPVITYVIGQGFVINGADPVSEFRQARDQLTTDGHTRTDACAMLDRAHLVALNTDLPDGLTVAVDEKFGGFMYQCRTSTGAVCKRSGGHDSPGGAAVYATMHRNNECTR